MLRRWIIAIAAVAVLAAVALGWQHSHRENPHDFFGEANAAYKSGNYKSAAELYQKTIDVGLVSAAVYYNIGNSYMKQNQLGQAIVNYERALQLDPRDSDTRANWLYAKALIKYPEPQEPKSFEQMLFVHLRYVTLDEIVIILTVILVAISALVLAGLFLQWQFRKTAVFIGLLSLVFIFHVFALLAKIEKLQDRAILLAPIEVKYEPEEKATTHFTAYEGWKVRVLKESAGWVKIERPDGLEGWVPRDKIERI